MIIMRPKVFYTRIKSLVIILNPKGYRTRNNIIMMILKTKKCKKMNHFRKNKDNEEQYYDHTDTEPKYHEDTKERWYEKLSSLKGIG